MDSPPWPIPPGGRSSSSSPSDRSRLAIGGTMNVQAPATTSVHKSIVVDAPIDRAFHVFTQEMESWWPPDHHILDAPVAETVVEPRVGGRIVDRGTDGSECQWARVLAYEPPTLFVFSWDINLQWQIETDHERTS